MNTVPCVRIAIQVAQHESISSVEQLEISESDMRQDGMQYFSWKLHKAFMLVPGTYRLEASIFGSLNEVLDFLFSHQEVFLKVTKTDGAVHKITISFSDLLDTDVETKINAGTLTIKETLESSTGQLRMDVSVTMAEYEIPINPNSTDVPFILMLRLTSQTASLFKNEVKIQCGCVEQTTMGFDEWSEAPCYTLLLVDSWREASLYLSSVVVRLEHEGVELDVDTKLLCLKMSQFHPRSRDNVPITCTLDTNHRLATLEACVYAMKAEESGPREMTDKLEAMWAHTKQIRQDLEREMRSLDDARAQLDLEKKQFDILKSRISSQPSEEIEALKQKHKTDLEVERGIQRSMMTLIGDLEAQLAKYKGQDAMEGTRPRGQEYTQRPRGRDSMERPGSQEYIERTRARGRENMERPRGQENMERPRGQENMDGRRPRGQENLSPMRAPLGSSENTPYVPIYETKMQGRDKLVDKLLSSGLYGPDDDILRLLSKTSHR